jgi:hypothetical protein
VSRTQKPFVAALRVNEPRPAELGQQAERTRIATGGKAERRKGGKDKAERTRIATAAVSWWKGGKDKVERWKGQVERTRIATAADSWWTDGVHNPNPF